jgi:hypothetical protein
MIDADLGILAKFRDANLANDALLVAGSLSPQHPDEGTDFISVGGIGKQIHLHPMRAMIRS